MIGIALIIDRIRLNCQSGEENKEVEARAMNISTINPFNSHPVVRSTFLRNEEIHSILYSDINSVSSKTSPGSLLTVILICRLAVCFMASNGAAVLS